MKIITMQRKTLDGDPVYTEEGNALALARIRLPLDILSDIKDNGYCSLSAEI